MKVKVLTTILPILCGVGIGWLAFENLMWAIWGSRTTDVYDVKTDLESQTDVFSLAQNRRFERTRNERASVGELHGRTV